MKNSKCKTCKYFDRHQDRQNTGFCKNEKSDLYLKEISDNRICNYFNKNLNKPKETK